MLDSTLDGENILYQAWGRITSIKLDQGLVRDIILAFEASASLTPGLI